MTQTIQEQISETTDRVTFMERHMDALLDEFCYRENLLRDLTDDYRSTFGAGVSGSDVKEILIRILAGRIGKVFKHTQVETEFARPYLKDYSSALMRVATVMFIVFRKDFTW